MAILPVEDRTIVPPNGAVAVVIGIHAYSLCQKHTLVEEFVAKGTIQKVG